MLTAVQVEATRSGQEGVRNRPGWRICTGHSAPLGYRTSLGKWYPLPTSISCARKVGPCTRPSKLALNIERLSRLRGRLLLLARLDQQARDAILFDQRVDLEEVVSELLEQMVQYCLAFYRHRQMKRRWEAVRDRLIANFPLGLSLIRGSLVQYYLTCGNPGCRCHRAKRHRHGPYWYVTVSYAAGRQKRYLIPPQKLPLARQGITAYDRMWKGLNRISELNLALLKSSDEP